MRSNKDFFDYIVIGLGAAGSIVAAHLASSLGASVMALEAGPELRPAKNRYWDPRYWAPLAIAPEIEWGFQSVPQAGLSGRVVALAQGRGRGGSQLHNAMVYVRGARRDYDHWADLGCAGWGLDDVLPYFRRVESRFELLTGAPDPFLDALFAAAEERGLSYNPDYNESLSQHGAALFRFTIDPKTMLRNTSYASYLVPALASGARLTIVQGTAVQILFDGFRAVGVRYLDSDGVPTVAHAGTEIVVSTGALSSPALLQRSGIGDAAHLRSLRIPVVADSPEVGANLYDDLYVTVAYAASRPLPEQPYGLSAGVLFASSTGRPDGPVDLEVSCSSGAMIGMPEIPSVPSSFWLWPNILHLTSRGTVKIQAPALGAPLRIDPGYLSEPEDMDRCIAGVTLGRAVGAAGSLASFRSREIAPGPDVVTNQQIAEYIRRTAWTTQHYVGTCRMGADDRAVVDLDLRVRGVEGLRVIDSSILPAPITGNTAAVSMMIGEKGAAAMIGRRA